MIFPESLLRVADNSGARLVRCIAAPRPFGREGDRIVVSVARCRPRSKVERGRLYSALLVQCRTPSIRYSGHRIGFRSNRVVLLKKQENRRTEVTPLGTRIWRPVSLLLRRSGYTKLIILAPSVL